MTAAEDGTNAPLPAAPRLALLEVREHDGRLLQVHDVRHWPLRIGRALDNDVVLLDPHAAAHHARLEAGADGRPRLVVGDSRNGVRLEAGRTHRTLTAGESLPLPPLARWQIGHGTLLLRLPSDPLPDERKLIALRAPPSQAAIGALLLAGLLWQLANLWLGGNPSTSWESYLLPLLATISTLGLWVVLWGLASKLFVHRINLGTHLRIALGWALAGLAIDALLGGIAYAIDAPLLSRVREPVGLLMLAGMVGHHLQVVVPGHRRWTNALVGVVAVTVIGGQTLLQLQRLDRPFRELYMSLLPPPSLRIVQGEPPAQLVDALRTLEAPLLERAREAARRDTEP